MELQINYNVQFFAYFDPPEWKKKEPNFSSYFPLAKMLELY
jgi:hypothetical protein